jgi:hypothetical protein
MGESSRPEIETLATVDREWAAAERAYWMTFQERDRETQRPVKVQRPPTVADVTSFRTWALVFASAGAIAGFVLRIADARGGGLAIGAGFGAFCVVAAIYAWVYAQRLQKVVTAYALAKRLNDERRAAVEREAEARAAIRNSERPRKRRAAPRREHR